MVRKSNIQSCDCSSIHNNLLEDAKQNMQNGEVLSNMVVFYKAFADNTRLKIINALYNTELCVCDISVLLNMTKSAVSHQLKYLKECSLIKGRKQGKEVFYSLSDKHVKIVFEICKEHILEIM